MENEIEYLFLKAASELGITLPETKNDSYKLNLKSCSRRPIVHGPTSFFASVFMPLFAVVPIYSCSWLNPCFNYVEELHLSVLISYIVSFVIVLSHLYLYNQRILFCSNATEKNHHLETIVLFLSMGATLGCFNLYVYDPSILYILFASSSYISTIVFYFSCLFQKHHYQICPLAGSPHLENNTNIFWKVNYSDLFTCFGVTFTMTWIAMFVLAMVFQGYLWKQNLRDVVVEEYGCVNFTISSG